MTEFFSAAGRSWDVTKAKKLVAGVEATVDVPVKLMYEKWLTNEPQETPDGIAMPSGKAWVQVDEGKALSETTSLDEPLSAV